MSRLTLFSLDALVNVPRLFTRGLQQATGAEERSVVDALIETGADPLRALGMLVSEEDVGGAYARFLPVVSRGAVHLVKEHAHKILNACRAVDQATGIFYPLPQRAVEDIVRSSKLRPNLQWGYLTLEELREKIDRQGAEEVVYVLGRIVRLPQEFVEAARSYRESRPDFKAFSEGLLE